MPSRATRGKTQTSVSRVSHAGRTQINPFRCGSDDMPTNWDLAPDRRFHARQAGLRPVAIGDGRVRSGDRAGRPGGEGYLEGQAFAGTVAYDLEQVV